MSDTVQDQDIIYWLRRFWLRWIDTGTKQAEQYANYMASK